MGKTFKKSESALKKEEKKNYDTSKSFIAPGAELEAALFKTNGSVAINGSFVGKLEAAKDTELLSEGVIDGDISTNNAIISGSMKGTISCKGFLEITQTANIDGDIVASTVEVEHGAIIDGTVKVRPKQIISIDNEANEK